MTAQSAHDAAPWPLTEAQSGLWYAQQLAPANVTSVTLLR